MDELQNIQQEESVQRSFLSWRMKGTFHHVPSGFLSSDSKVLHFTREEKSTETSVTQCNGNSQTERMEGRQTSFNLHEKLGYQQKKDARLMAS